MKNVTALDEIAALVNAGSLRPFFNLTFPLEQVADAFKASMGGQVLGKISICVAC